MESQRSLPRLGVLISAMLRADDDRVHAQGSGEEAGQRCAEEYWMWDGAARLSAHYGTVTTGPRATVVQPRGRRGETAAVEKAWLGWTDRLLHPRHLYIWGRSGEDWRLGDVEGWSSEVDMAVALPLEPVEDARIGQAHVVSASGRVVLLDLPGHVCWHLDSVDNAPDVATWPRRRWFQECLPPDHAWP